MRTAPCTLSRPPWPNCTIYCMPGPATLDCCRPGHKKTKKETSDVYKKERMELLRKILSYKDCRKVDCSIIIPTCLRMPTLVLPPVECMQRYHNPCLQGLFAHKYPENSALSNLGETSGTPSFRRTSDGFPHWRQKCSRL